MKPETNTLQRVKPYRLAAAICIVLAYQGVVVWVFSLPVEQMQPSSKFFFLIILLSWPGGYLMDWHFKEFPVPEKLQNRLRRVAFISLCVGLNQIENAVGRFGAIKTFVLTFVAVAIVIFTAEVMLDWLCARWKQRNNRALKD